MIPNFINDGLHRLGTLFWQPNSPYYFIYLLTSLVVAGLIVLLRGNGYQKLRGIFSKEYLFHPSSAADVGFIIVKHGLVMRFVMPFATIFITTRYFYQLFLDKWGAGLRVETTMYHYILFNLIYFLLFDFARYLSHYIRHKWWPAWEFHKVHHSALVLTPLTAIRTHPLETLLSVILTNLFVSPVLALSFWYFNQPPSIYTFFSVHIWLLLFYISGYHLRHSHVWLQYPVWLQYVLISPAQHQIHHSNQIKHRDKNLGFILAIWDVLFKTIYICRKKENFSIGINPDDDTAYLRVSNLFFRPFWVIFKKVVAKMYKQWAVIKLFYKEREKI